MKELLVVALGNPGPRYALTRHNAGFIFLDFLAQGLGATFQVKSSLEAEYAEITLAEARVHLLKPMTFMNLSGRSVAAFTQNKNITADNILVVHDEVEIALGRVKLKLGGSDAGHNGLDSIRESIGSGEFYRLRIGVGRPSIAGMDLAAWVLQKFTKPEQEQLAQVLSSCEEVLEVFIKDGLQKAQTKMSMLGL